MPRLFAFARPISIRCTSAGAPPGQQTREKPMQRKPTFEETLAIEHDKSVARQLAEERRRQLFDRQVKGATMEETMGNVYDYVQRPQSLVPRPMQLAVAQTLDGRPYAPALPPSPPLNLWPQIRQVIIDTAIDRIIDAVMKPGFGAAGGVPGRGDDTMRPGNPKVPLDPLTGPQRPIY